MLPRTIRTTNASPEHPSQLVLERIASGWGRLLGSFSSAQSSSEAEAEEVRPGLIGRVFAGRPDREHEMVINRLVICALTVAYLVSLILLQVPGVEDAAGVVALYCAVSVALLLSILKRPGISFARRSVALIADMGCLSYGMHLGGEPASMLYPIYLWAIFGNGFRFGLTWLFAATAAALLGFGITAATTVYWIANPHLALGLWAGLVILPLYAATLIRKLSMAKQEAEEASRAKSLFLASVSHELRTPLNAVIGLSGLLRQMNLDREQQEMVRTIGSSGRQLLSLIDSLLDISRLQAGRTKAQSVPFDLHALLAEVQAMLQVQAQGKGVRLGIHATPRTPFRLQGNQRHLQEILINLGGNAIKFTERGSVAIGVDAVRTETGRFKLRVEVSDTGIGIAQEARERIFERFTQADDTIIDRFGGTGLGLAIVKQLVELQGGRIGVDSEPGLGSTFWFEIEVDAEDLEPGASVAPLEARVILATLDPVVVETARQALPPRGVGVDVAALQAQVLTSARSAIDESARCVIVLDERYAGIDAEALAACLREIDPNDLVSVHLLTVAGPHGLPAHRLRTLYRSLLPLPLSEEALTSAVHLGFARDLDAEATKANSDPAVAERCLTILVADDNRTNQKVIGKVLERAGHKVAFADNGEQALDALNRQTFDLVLMDVNMPLLSGIEATKLYRFISLGKRYVPIVALTADATPDASRRCREAGMDACLTKPIEPRELLNTIMAIVADNAVATQTSSESAGTGAAEPIAASAGLWADAQSIADFSEGSALPGRDREPGEPEAIDARALKDLETLGGRDFVRDLVRGFLDDAEEVLRELGAAVAKGDAPMFQDQLHALRSGAANVGARGVFEACLAWRQATAGELAMMGSTYLDQLEAEFTRVREAAAPYLVDDTAARRVRRRAAGQSLH